MTDEFLEELIEHMTKAIEPESYAAMIVPDSIEPIYGWKALRITPDGRLASPQQATIWPVKQRLEATCSSNKVTYAWTAVRGEPKEMGLQQPPPGVVVASTSTTILSTSSHIPEKPKTALPVGMSWSWEAQPHEIASNDCRCGIYVVDNVRAAGSYISDNCILAEVCLWGRVVPGSDGARGQYAYPRQLFAPDTLTDVATMVAQLYGVPIGYRDHKTGKTLSHRQAMENLAAMKSAVKPKPFKQKNVPMTNPQTVTPTPQPILKLPSQIPPPSPGEVGTSFSVSGGQPTGGTLIIPESLVKPVDPQLLLKGQLVFGICWTLIFFFWVLAITINPNMLVGVLPCFAVQFAMIGKRLRS